MFKNNQLKLYKIEIVNLNLLNLKIKLNFIKKNFNVCNVKKNKN